MKIAFFSDIHFGKLAISSEYSVEGEALQDVEIENACSSLLGLKKILKEEKPDYLFIAGDLTSTGSPLEFEHCYQFISMISKEIGVLKENVLFCLGNHDIDWRITRIIDSYDGNLYKNEDKEIIDCQYKKMARNIAIDILERECNRAIKPNYKEVFNAPFGGVVEFTDCIVFVLNTAVEGSHLQEPKHGSLGNDQIEWFKENAQKYSNNPKPKICLLHHHPRLYADYLRILDISNLEEGGEFVNICGCNNISLVLHGHKHQPHAITQHETDWKKPITFICAGSLSVNYSHRYNAIQNTFHIINYIRDDYIELKNFSYTPHMGWRPTKYSEATPVDSLMLLGRIICEKEARDIISKFPINTLIKYDELDEKLKYMPRIYLDQLIKSVFSEKTVMIENENYYIAEV